MIRKSFEIRCRKKRIVCEGMQSTRLSYEKEEILSSRKGEEK